MSDITRLKQLKDYPIGDCQRTVFACLLGYEDPKKVPNFTEMEGSFVENIANWLNENNLEFIEMTVDSFEKAYFVPLGFCTVAGKSPRGEYNHIVIGKISTKDNKYILTYEHDTSPHHDGKYLEDVQYIGFLTKRIHS